MELDEQTIKLWQIFTPGLFEHYKTITKNNKRFAYYTSADTGRQIIENNEVWLRNATVMNDFSEINYGLDLIRRAFAGPTGDEFRKLANEIFPDALSKLDNTFEQWVLDWEFETYITCVSEHELEEDKHGRLSMWRAYGDIALVLNNTSFVYVTDKLGVHSTPVNYLSLEDYEGNLQETVNQVSSNVGFIKELGEEAFSHSVYSMLFRSAIATKHPGFKEEKEWRIYYRPNEHKNGLFKKKTVTIGGTAQEVCVLPLEHDPEKGLFHADLPSLLDRVIIGPTDYPYVSSQAFRNLLAKAGAENVEVIESDIPIRTK